MVLITMSTSFDPDYIRSQLAIQDNNSRDLTLARERYAESAAISLVVAGINWLVDKCKIDQSTANLIKSSVKIMGSFAKAWFGL